MKYVILALTVMATAAVGGYEYEGQWGQYGEGPGDFKRPYDIGVWTYYGGAGIFKVFVTDWNDRVQVFTAAGDYLYEWGSTGSGPGQFDHPRGIDVAEMGGFVYVADTFNHRVQWFDNWGNYMGQWGSYGQGNYKFDRPWDVAVHPGNNNVYVTDHMNFKVKYYTASGGFLGSWGGFVSPFGISVDQAGYVYVVESTQPGHPQYPNGYSRVKKFTSTGSYITEWGNWGSGYMAFEYGMCCDESDDGRLYVPGERSNYVICFRTTGIPEEIDRFGTGWLLGPTGCGFQHGGRVYVADNYHHRVVYFLDDVFAPPDKRLDNLNILPESFGKIKAMFK